MDAIPGLCEQGVELKSGEAWRGGAGDAAKPKSKSKAKAKSKSKAKAKAA